jgi:MarR family transcriptional regulator, transcriptional regulator for hemolysin
MAGAEASKITRRTEKSAEAGFRALIRASGLLDRVMQPYFGRYGISSSQWGVLRVLQRAEGAGKTSIRLVDLGERLFVRPPSVSGLIDRMERLGYVVRSASAEDLRSREVRLTQEGRDLMDRILLNHATQIKTVMHGLAIQEQEQLIPLLERLISHLEDMVEKKNIKE